MIPNFEIHFDANGELRGASGWLPDGIANLLVLCHGWNNTAEEARELYQGLLRLVSAGPVPERCAAALVFWPSKQFAEAGPELMGRLRPEMFDAEDGAAVLARLCEREWFELLAPPFPRLREDAQGAAGLGGTMRRIGNLASYYVMKDRAGVVGRRGLAQWLSGLPGDVRLHLVGHSFGARLCTAAAQVCGADSLTLLQAAFSHFAFAEKFDGVNDGAFRDVITGRKVRGAIAITHSRHDRAVGLAYAVASRIAGQNASALGGPEDEFGGLGRNGARRTPEAIECQCTRSQIAVAAVHNIRADEFIQGHSDVVKPEVAALIAQHAMCSSGNGSVG